LKTQIIVSRFKKGKSWTDEFYVDIKVGTTVLDLLKTLKDDFDGSLSFRHSCRSGICGSCAIQINGTGKLACKTQVIPEIEKFGSIRIEPLKGADVLKDLVVDFKRFFDVLPELETWIEPGEENIKISSEEIEPVDEAAGCILCGICTFNCETYLADHEFAGPAAMAHAFKIVADPRGKETKRKLKRAADKGLWSCSRSYYCSELCPKDVKPGEKIFGLRSLCLRHGLDSTSGARRILEFRKSLEMHGRLNETLLPLKVKGIKSASLLPIGLKLLRKGRLPSPFIKDIDGQNMVKEIFRRKET
jgi:succinate dehydrogenase / fumarate reductase iron-sulfur subunit